MAFVNHDVEAILRICGQNVVNSNGRHLCLGSQHELTTQTNAFDEQVPLQGSRIEHRLAGAQ